MNVQEAYNLWSSQYDENENKTRDLEAIALRSGLSGFNFENCLEIGCGTGKNTDWLLQKAKRIRAVDFSEQMLARAKSKINDKRVQFQQADITKDWSFINESFDLVTFSLILEHIQDLDHIFRETSKTLNAGGYVYVGELHPFKQYSGTKARFETETGLQVPDCYTHHISDFIYSARKSGLSLLDLQEHFDNDDRNAIPRILVLIFQKSL